MTPATARPSDSHRRFPDDAETDVWSGCFSPKAMTGSFAAVVALTAAALIGMLITAFTGPGWLLIFLTLAIPPLWLVQILRVVKRCLSAQYRLTNRRLFLQIGFINRHKDQLDLSRVEDVRVLQNVLHRFFDVGSIEILSSDRRLRRVVMEGIENADEVAETIRTLSRRARPVAAEAAPSTRS